MSDSYFSEVSFKDKLITLIVKDREFLRQCAPILDKKDFDLNGDSSKVDKIKASIAQLGLDFYEKHNEPIGSLAKAEVISYSKKHKMPDAWRSDALGITKDKQGYTIYHQKNRH